ncbi:hypothetical protein [Devosia beringensis]|uniref:hypothetical protein n=1 Tax=Devosia beringensis TaxID=2657486 RepID=UPI00186B5B33|nr:hypothetical protein [Devosia beringensis]
MYESASYPACLRRPDAGGWVQTRVAKTEAAYRKRYVGMAKTWCKKHGLNVVSALDLAADLGGYANGLRKSSLKQYHAAFRQHLRDQWDDGAIELDMIERIDALLREQIPMQVSEGRTRLRTSAGRAKTVKPETLNSLVFELLKRPTAIRRIAAAQLRYGVELATRPSEFLTLRLDPYGRLWITSAKYSETNSRGLVRVRMVISDNLSALDVAELKRIAELLLIERAAGATYRTLLSRCQRAIRLARPAVGGNSRQITAYSVRHQARANMMAMGMTAEQVAVVMNHASAMTAQSHYAPSRLAWKGMVGAKPPHVDPDLVARVRPGNSSRGWPSQQPQPGPRV